MQKERPKEEQELIEKWNRESPFKFSCALHADYMMKKVYELDKPVGCSQEVRQHPVKVPIGGSIPSNPAIK